MIKERKERLVKITGISPKDAYYKDREKYIGLVGMFLPDTWQGTSGYFAGRFSHSIFLSGGTTFFAIRYKKVKEDGQPPMD